MQTIAVHDVERKSIAILEALAEMSEPLGSTAIARRLKEYGIELSERTVRYHFKFLDERGLTIPVGRDGRMITPRGREELRNALVGDKIGFVLARIEALAYQTNLDLIKLSGLVPVNLSLFPKKEFRRCLDLMKPVFSAGLCVSDKVRIAGEGERLGEVVVPEGKIGLATVCSIVINGCLLKAGIPMDSKFGGILQMRNGKPLRFVDVIHYAGSSLDPSEAFIRARMTDVQGVVKDGQGKLLANFREIPSSARLTAEHVIHRLRDCRFGGMMVMGTANEAVCEIPVGPNRVGIILLGGLTPVAAIHEDGIELENRPMSGLMDYQELEGFENAYDKFAAIGY
jgi:repressor of nif and glnA expression